MGDGVLPCENRVQAGCKNGGTDCENMDAGCKNGGTRLQSGMCLCPKPFYGDLCQKRLCGQYVEVKEPSTALYKRLALATPLLTRYQIIYRTRYTSATKCREDLEMGQRRQGDVVGWIHSEDEPENLK